MDVENYLYNDSIFVLDNSIYDRFNEILAIAEHQYSICIEGEKYFKGFTQIIGDVWLCFYSNNPTSFIMKPNISAARKHFIDELFKQETYRSWYMYTKSDALLSILTTMMISEQFLQHIKNDEQMKNDAIKRNISEKKLEMAVKKMEQLSTEKLNNPEQRNNEIITRSTLKMMRDAKHELEEFEQNRQKTLTSFSIKLEEVIHQANIQSLQRKEGVIALGTLDGKKVDQLPLKDQLQIAEHLTSNEIVRQVAEMTGKFKKIVKKKMKSTSTATIARKNIALGNEIDRTLSIELANYIMPASKMNFLKRYAESQLLVFDKKGKNQKGKGPIVICMDESSSMMPIRAESKAFCLALLMIAKKQKRDFAIIPFASDIGSTQIFPKGRANTEDIIQFSKNFLGGGTNFEKPLNQSLNILKESNFNEADVLFVTDGSSFLTSSFINEYKSVKKQRNFECTSIVLTNLFNAVDLKVVKQFSDRVIEVNNLFEADTVFSLQ